MPDTSTLITALFAMSNVLTLTLATGMIFAVLVQPRREKTGVFFAMFCTSLALWAVFSLADIVPALRFELPSHAIESLLATASLITSATFFVFILRYTQTDSRLSRILFLVLPVVLLAGLVLIWTGQLYAPADPNAQLTPTTLGYVFKGVVAAYGVFSLWVVLSSRKETSSSLQIPALLVALALIATAIPGVDSLPLGTLATAIAAVWIGVMLLRLEMFNPINEMSYELSTANRDLRQALGDLARERARSEQLNRDLQAASGYKGEFLTNMSHKVRTPLNSIVGYSELLESGIYGELTEKQRDRLEKIHRNGQTVLELINNMLDLSKIEAGRLELDLSVFPVDKMVENAVASVEPQRTERHLDLRVELDPEVLPLSGDQKRIEQVLLHLLTNAIKFTPSGTIELKALNVRVHKGTSSTFNLPMIGWLSDGEWVILLVKDTGIGIAPEDQARIFDEFYQVDESHAAELGGTGLGLTITRRLVELHQGVVWVKSALQQGSTFFVALPAYVSSTEARSTQETRIVKTA